METAYLPPLPSQATFHPTTESPQDTEILSDLEIEESLDLPSLPDPVEPQSLHLLLHPIPQILLLHLLQLDRATEAQISPRTSTDPSLDNVPEEADALTNCVAPNSDTAETAAITVTIEDKEIGEPTDAMFQPDNASKLDQVST